MQYCQEHQRHLPPSNEFFATLAPNLPRGDAFSVAGHRFHYLRDGEAITIFSKPAEEEVGDFDLSSGRVVLYLDGHVEVVGRDGKAIASQ